MKTPRPREVLNRPIVIQVVEELDVNRPAFQGSPDGIVRGNTERVERHVVLAHETGCRSRRPRPLVGAPTSVPNRRRLPASTRFLAQAIIFDRRRRTRHRRPCPPCTGQSWSPRLTGMPQSRSRVMPRSLQPVAHGRAISGRWTGQGSASLSLVSIAVPEAGPSLRLRAGRGAWFSRISQIGRSREMGSNAGRFRCVPGPAFLVQLCGT